MDIYKFWNSAVIIIIIILILVGLSPRKQKN